MAEGRTNAGIAKRLWLTEKTVETHVRTILMKLGLRSATKTTGACSPSSRTCAPLGLALGNRRAKFRAALDVPRPPRT